MRAGPDLAAAPRPAWRSTWRQRWQRWHRPVLAGFGLAVLALVAWRLHSLDWAAAWRAVQAMPASTLWGAAALSALGHANYGAFDLLARRWLRLAVPRWRIWWSATVSYAFTLNCGSLIGGAAVRWRLLNAAGVGAAAVAQVVSLAVATNWLGYALVTGVLLVSGNGFLADAVTLPADADAGADAGAGAPGPAASAGGDLKGYADTLQAWLASPAAFGVGVALLGVVVLWAGVVVVRAGRSGRAARPLRWRSRQVTLPRPGVAATQVLLGGANWLWMAGAVWWLLVQQTPDLPFRLVLAAQVLASLAGLVARVPGGLGVFEAVYWVMLGSRVASGPLLGALLVFRVVYYLAPLGIALIGYGALTRRRAAP